MDGGNGMGGKMTAQGPQRGSAREEDQRRGRRVPQRGPVHAATLPGTSPSSSMRK